MRISDWGSDVCSSDLHAGIHIDESRRIVKQAVAFASREDLRSGGKAVIDDAFDFPRLRRADERAEGDILGRRIADPDRLGKRGQIGRAPCRERGWQYA